MKARNESLLLFLKSRLEAAKEDLASARDAFGYTGAGGYVARNEGRIEELDAVIAELEKEAKREARREATAKRREARFKKKAEA